MFHQVTTGSLGCFELAPDHGMAFTPQAMTLMATFEPTPSPTSESAPALNSGPTPGPTSVQPEHLLQDSYLLRARWLLFRFERVGCCLLALRAEDETRTL